MMMEVGGVPLYRFVCKRCGRVGGVDAVIMATSVERSDDPLAAAAERDGFRVYRGSLENVLERYVDCARNAGCDTVVRVSGDSPFVDTEKAGILLSLLAERNLEYAAFLKERCIDGLDSEVIRLSALERALASAETPGDLEHVTRYIRRNPESFRCEYVDFDCDPFGKRVALTVDTAGDLEFCDEIALALFRKAGGETFDFSTEDVIGAIREKIETRKDENEGSPVSATD